MDDLFTSEPGFTASELFTSTIDNEDISSYVGDSEEIQEQIEYIPSFEQVEQFEQTPEYQETSTNIDYAGSPENIDEIYQFGSEPNYTGVAEAGTTGTGIEQPTESIARRNAGSENQPDFKSEEILSELKLIRKELEKGNEEITEQIESSDITTEEQTEETTEDIQLKIYDSIVTVDKDLKTIYRNIELIGTVVIFTIAMIVGGIAIRTFLEKIKP